MEPTSSRTSVPELGNPALEDLDSESDDDYDDEDEASSDSFAAELAGGIARPTLRTQARAQGGGTSTSSENVEASPVGAAPGSLLDILAAVDDIDSDDMYDDDEDDDNEDGEEVDFAGDTLSALEEGDESADESMDEYASSPRRPGASATSEASAFASVSERTVDSSVDSFAIGVSALPSALPARTTALQALAEPPSPMSPSATSDGSFEAEIRQSMRELAAMPSVDTPEGPGLVPPEAPPEAPPEGAQGRSSSSMSAALAAPPVTAPALPAVTAPALPAVAVPALPAVAAARGQSMLPPAGLSTAPPAASILDEMLDEADEADGADEADDDALSSCSVSSLPEHWEAQELGDGRTYYWHVETNETTWDRPRRPAPPPRPPPAASTIPIPPRAAAAQGFSQPTTSAASMATALPPATPARAPVPMAAATPHPSTAARASQSAAPAVPDSSTMSRRHEASLPVSLPVASDAARSPRDNPHMRSSAAHALPERPSAAPSVVGAPKLTAAPMLTAAPIMPSAMDDRAESSLSAIGIPAVGQGSSLSAIAIPSASGDVGSRKALREQQIAIDAAAAQLEQARVPLSLRLVVRPSLTFFTISHVHAISRVISHATSRVISHAISRAISHAISRAGARGLVPTHGAS